MIFAVLATLCAGLFSGAAIYVSVVEHPARLSCGTTVALTEFRPSYHRAAIMQAFLAIAGCAAGIAAWLQDGKGWLLAAALLLGSVVPFTLLIIWPTNKRLLDPELAPHAPEAALLLTHWGRLHAVRSAVSAVSFVVFLLCLATK